MATGSNKDSSPLKRMSFALYVCRDEEEEKTSEGEKGGWKSYIKKEVFPGECKTPSQSHSRRGPTEIERKRFLVAPSSRGGGKGEHPRGEERKGFAVYKRPDRCCSRTGLSGRGPAARGRKDLIGGRGRRRSG